MCFLVKDMHACPREVLVKRIQCHVCFDALYTESRVL